MMITFLGLKNQASLAKNFWNILLVLIRFLQFETTLQIFLVFRKFAFRCHFTFKVFLWQARRIIRLWTTILRSKRLKQSIWLNTGGLCNIWLFASIFMSRFFLLPISFAVLWLVVLIAFHANLSIVEQLTVLFKRQNNSITRLEGDIAESLANAGGRITNHPKVWYFSAIGEKFSDLLYAWLIVKAKIMKK